MIFRSELQKIADGSEIYNGISRSRRRRCLKNLAEYVGDERYKVKLIVVSDEQARHLKHLLRDYDRFSVNGERFAMWSYHSDRVAGSENRAIVRRHRKIIEELMTYSLFRDPCETATFLLKLCAELPN